MAKNFDTVKESARIRKFLNERKHFLNLWGICREAGLSYGRLSQFMRKRQQTLSYSTINKVSPILGLLGFFPDKSILTLDYIRRFFSSYYKINPMALSKRSRKREVIKQRHTAMYFSKQLTYRSFARIGAYFGGFDHNTCRHACKAIQDLIDTNKVFRREIEEIEKLIKKEQ
jgi:chromosomal replication initiation ATPase DnaA